MKREDGFTLVELLVVIGIIGLLAAIAIPSFLAQRSRATDSEAVYAVTNARKAMEAYHVENDSYNASASDLVAIESALADAPNLTVNRTLPGIAMNFSVTVDTREPRGGGTFWVVEATNGETYRACTNPGQGGCKRTPTGRPWPAGYGIW